jgi:hypothetical protein
MSSLPEKTEQIIRSHAILIVTVVKVCQNPQLLPELEPLLAHAQNNGWTALVAAIRNILKGKRNTSALTGLDEEDTIIIDAILRGLQNPDTLPDVNAKPQADLAAPALANMIHAACTGDAMALSMIATMAEQMTNTQGDMARLGGAISKMVNNDERDPDILCKNMSEKGEKLVVDILAELTKLSTH